MKYLIIILLFFTACNQNLSERYYKSSDEVTGGFNDFSLFLHSDGKLILTIKTAIAEAQQETGTQWAIKTKTVEGEWQIKNNIINYSIVHPLSTDSIFTNLNLNFANKPILSFSPKLDTAYVYGIPCALSPTNKKRK